MRRGGGGQLEQEAVSSPGAVLLAGGCRRSGLLPGARVSPGRPLLPMPQLEHLLHGGYPPPGRTVPGAELHVPLGQAGEQREGGSCSGELLAQSSPRGFLSLPGPGWAGQEGAVAERLPVGTGLCKGKQELPEREVNASPRAVISVLPGWRPSLPLPLQALLWLCKAGWGLLPQLALGLWGGGQFAFHLNC